MAPAPATPLRQVGAGFVGAAASLAVVLTLGLLARIPLAGTGVGNGVAAALVTVVVGGCVVLVLARRRGMPAAGPSSATALLHAGLLASLMKAAPAEGAAGPDAMAMLLVACGVVAASGLLQIAFGLLRLGRLAGRVPAPVLSGFMNGIAALIVLAQLPGLLGIDPTVWRADPLAALRGATALSITVAAVTVAAYAACRRWRPAAPAPLIALGAGVLLDALWRHVTHDAPHGLQVADVAAGHALWPWAGMAEGSLQAAGALVLDRGPALLLAAAALAVVAALETVLNALATDRQLQLESRPDRELVHYGAANVAVGLLGGLPLVNSRARAVATLQAGGQGLLSAWAGLGVFAVLAATGHGFIGLLPVAALSGIMLVVAWGLADRWSGRLLRQWLAGDRSAQVRENLAVVGVVMAVTLGLGFVAGVTAGVVLSMHAFIRSMNRALVRAVHPGDARPSRRMYPADIETALQPLRRRVVIVELDGALFFGSTERLQQAVTGVPEGTCCIVLDLRRVGTADASAALALVQMTAALRLRGVSLHLAGAPAGHPVAEAMATVGGGSAAAAALLPRHDDVDRAMEAVEAELLATLPAPPPMPSALPLARCALLRGLAPAEAEVVTARMRRHALAAGDFLFRQGDAADCLYVLTAGSLTIAARGIGHLAGPRFLSASPGTTVGETAMLDGAGRSADAVADGPCELWSLSRHDLDALGRDHPHAANRLHANLALHLSQRLRAASIAWQASAG